MDIKTIKFTGVFELTKKFQKDDYPEWWTWKRITEYEKELIDLDIVDSLTIDHIILKENNENN
jgi:hypothetical protein